MRVLLLPRGDDEKDARSLMLSGLLRRTPIIGDGPRVSMTTYGTRLRTVHLAIESIARGEVRPQSLTLWLETVPQGRVRRRLRRLEKRGLTIGHTESFGPHTKYFPAVIAAGGVDSVLVTADDDVLYPPNWLARLASASRAEPDLIHCHRAHRVVVVDGVIAPYSDWTPVTDTEARLDNFATGVSGTIYPALLLRELAALGTGFRQAAPTADDIWLHATAVEAGILTRQLTDRPMHYPAVPGSQVWGLYAHNVVGGANDVQARLSYTARAIALLVDSAHVDRA